MKRILLIVITAFIAITSVSSFIAIASVSSPIAITIKDHDCIEAGMSAGEDFPHTKVGIKAILAGALNQTTGNMEKKLLKAGYLPSSINDTNFFDWYYPKQKKWVDINHACLESSIAPGELVDFVQVILVDDPYNPTEMHYRLGRLDSAGNVRSFNNRDQYLKFFVPEDRGFYVIVTHRNHNGIMSSIPIRGDYVYDFTSDINNVWGGYYGVIEIGGKICMIPGDGAGSYQNGWDLGKGDNFTDLSDKIVALNDTIRGQKGYYETDYNLDGIVNTKDVEIASLYWSWGSAIEFCIPTGDPWSLKRVPDYNMNGQIDGFDKAYHLYAIQHPFIFPSSLDYNNDGKFDLEDRLFASSLLSPDLILPTYRLDGVTNRISNDSVDASIYLKATNNERLDFKSGQFIIQIDSFTAKAVHITGGDLSYTVLPPTQAGVVSILATVPNGTIAIDSARARLICSISIVGERKGKTTDLLHWRNGPQNPFTKIFTVVDSLITEITMPENHFWNLATGLSEEVNFHSHFGYYLSQNYPNPFNPVTNINFSLPEKTLVSLVIYDMTGREIQILVNNVLSAGSYNYSFTADNLTSGVYFYKLTAGNFTETKKMTLIK